MKKIILNYEMLKQFKHFNHDFSKFFDSRYKLIKLKNGHRVNFYDNRISSFSEIINCSDVLCGDGDFFSNIRGFYIDRDAAATDFDAHVNHNNGIKRDLNISILDQILKTLEELENICLVTSKKYIGQILYLFGEEFITKLSINSFYICNSIEKDRIYLINLTDKYINIPALHGKIRDLT